MRFFKKKAVRIIAPLLLIPVIASLIIYAPPQSVSAQLPTLDPNAVRAAVLNMGMDSLSKVVLTDPPQLLTYVNTATPVANTATVPPIAAPPAALTAYAADNGLSVQRAALLILGKSLFWDQQVGSDGQACATCHFQAGADPRSLNVLNPGSRNTNAAESTQFNAVASNPTGAAPGPNYQMNTNDFPFFQLSDPMEANYQNREITFDTNDIVGSQGTYHATYAGSPAPNYDTAFAQGTYDTAAPRVLDPVFNVGGVNVRSVGPRQAGPAVNAVFNDRNFWDGRASNSFNGVNPLGLLDQVSMIWRNTGTALGQDFGLVTNSSLASQSVGPPSGLLSDEIAFSGRTMPDLGRKLLRLTGPGKGAAVTATVDTVTASPTYGQVTALTLTAPGSGYQAGATINILGSGSGATATATVNLATGAITGLTLTAPGSGYTAAPTVTIFSNGLGSNVIIPLGAQQVSITDSVLGPFVNGNGKGINMNYAQLIQWAFVSAYWDAAGPPDPVTGLPTTLVTGTGFQPMEANFTLFWGLAIQAYETTLRADQTAYDKFMGGDNTALTQEQLRGLLTYIHTESFTQQPDPMFNNIGFGACQLCHSGPELTEVSLANVPVKGFITNDMTVTQDHNRALAIVASSSNFDVGFTNVSVRPWWEDLGIGGSENGAPLSLERQVLKGFPFALPPLAPAAPNPSRGTNLDGAFKIPSIRNIDLTSPYYHNGSMLTLMQTAQFYARQGNFADLNEGNTDVGQAMVFANDADNHALVAFMLSLTDERVRWEKAPFDHPQLFVPNGANTVVANTVLGAGYASDNYITLPAIGASGRTPQQGPLTNFLGIRNYPGEVASIAVNIAGSGYTSAPTVTISAPPAGGIQATAVATVSTTNPRHVTGIYITNPGAYYTTPPTITISGGGGSNATATATLASPSAITHFSP